VEVASMLMVATLVLPVLQFLPMVTVPLALVPHNALHVLLVIS
jgi:hypothetical protein